MFDAIASAAVDIAPTLLESAMSGLARGFATTAGRRVAVAASDALFGDPSVQRAQDLSAIKVQQAQQLAQLQMQQQMFEAASGQGSADQQDAIASQIMQGYQMAGGGKIR